MKYEAGNRFNPDTYFKTEVDSTSVTVKVTGELEGVEVSFDSGDVPEITTLSVTENGTYEAPEGTAYDPVTVAVPNTYTAEDAGKVVVEGALVSQTSTEKTANGTYDTTTNNEVVVDVANSYTAADEGKVVSSGALVAQTSRSVTANGTYDTTTNNEVVVNVSAGNSDLIDLIERDITSIIIPQGVTSIGAYAFRGCNSLASVTIPQGVTSVDDYAFSNLPSLQNVVFPEGLITVGGYVFYQNNTFSSPVTVDLPSTVTNIGNYCFRNNRNLTLYCRASTPPTLDGTSVFGDTGTNLKIYVPSESVEDYKAAANWSSVASYIFAIPTT